MFGVTICFSIGALVLSALTLDCGFTIHSGGESFRKAIRGHMVLGIITVLLVLTTTIMLVLE